MIDLVLGVAREAGDQIADSEIAEVLDVEASLKPLRLVGESVYARGGDGGMASVDVDVVAHESGTKTDSYLLLCPFGERQRIFDRKH